MSAYPECYAARARDHLAAGFSLAIDSFGIDGVLFSSAFASSAIAQGYERGCPLSLAGISGDELFRRVMHEKFSSASGCETRYAGDVARPPISWAERESPPFIDTRTCAYWIGWCAALCQWELSCSFGSLFEALPYPTFEQLYPAYHEMDSSRMVQHAQDALRASASGDTALARLRHAQGLTQKELSRRARVGLRSIQMYEQRNNDIDKAEAATLLRLSRALGCRMEDLMEDPCGSSIEYAYIRI